MMTTSEKTIRANIDSRYYMRFLLIGIAAVGFSLWSLYDGAVKYPRQRERALEYQKLDKEGRRAEWREYALQRGWPTDPPGDPKTSVDFAMQYIMAAIAVTVGLPLLLVVWRSRGRWIEVSESGLTSSWGQRVDFDQVVSLDKRRWRGKGIAKVKYQHGRRRRRLVLDNYKFDRSKTDMILYELESRIGAEKVVGGPLEPPPEQQSQDSPEPTPDP